jgi:salicylate hydroxylase
MIYEAAPKFDAVGAGIGPGPNALEAMEAMDPTPAKMYNEIKVVIRVRRGSMNGLRFWGRRKVSVRRGGKEEGVWDMRSLRAVGCIGRRRLRL